MKILFLNLWHGKVANPLQDFLKSGDTFDIACFQEFADDAKEIVRAAFPEYHLVLAEKHTGYKADFSVATLVHPRHTIENQMELLQPDEESGLALSVDIKTAAGELMTIVNVHGTARKRENGQFLDNDEKLDFPARLRQTAMLLQHLEEKSGRKIVGGDFNMLPEAESMQAFAKAGYRDLIHEYSISTTRNHLSWDLYPNAPYLFFDYVFTSLGVKVKNFSVPNVEISDHLPMILEME